MARRVREYLRHEDIVAYWKDNPPRDCDADCYSIQYASACSCGGSVLRDGFWPACMGCAAGVYKWRHLERCHLRDHARGGPDDDPSNLVLLCRRCHSQMPSFGDRDAALEWVLQRTNWMKEFSDKVMRALAIYEQERRLEQENT